MGFLLLRKIPSFFVRISPAIPALVAIVFSQPLRAQTNVPAAQNLLPLPASSSTSTAALLNSMDALNDATKLSNRDRISYRVIEERKDPDLLTISDSGELEVPLLGRYPAAGKTCKQLALELKPLLEKDYFFKATVIIGIDTINPLPPPPPGKIYFMGQVHVQGAIDLPAHETLTLSKAILLNGGLADFADLRKIKLMRKKPDGTTEITVVDLVEINKGHSEKDPVLQAGDTINVPEKLINF